MILINRQRLIEWIYTLRYQSSTQLKGYINGIHWRFIRSEQKTDFDLYHYKLRVRGGSGKEHDYQLYRIAGETPAELLEKYMK